RAGVLLEQVTGERRRDDRAAAVDADDRLAQLLTAAALGQIARCAGGDRVEQRLRLLVGGDDQDLRLGRRTAQLLEHAQSARPRHVEIQENDVGLQLA